MFFQNMTLCGMTEMKRIARFIKRGRKGEKDNGAIIILKPDGADYLEEDMVYEIFSIFGEMSIREIGKTHMAPKEWGRQIQDVMMFDKPVLTKAEAKRLEEMEND